MTNNNPEAVQKYRELAIDNLPVVKSMQELRQALSLFPSDQYNVLMPGAMNFGSPLFKVAFEVVVINPVVDDRFNGVDIYSVDRGQTYTFHTKALNKIAAAANIVWTSSETVRIEYENEGSDAGRITRVEHAVSFSIKRANGATRTGVSVGYYNYAEDKARFKADQANSRRHFAVQLAEANAKLRGIFDALDQLPRQFTKEQMAKPFIVPCVVEDVTDLIRNDPEAKSLYMAHLFGATEALYGPQQASRPALAIPTQSEVVPDEKPKPAAQASPQPAAQPAMQADPSRMTKEEAVEAFKAMKSEERQKELARILTLKGMRFPADADFSKFDDDRQVKALTYYYLQPDAKKFAFDEEAK